MRLRPFLLTTVLALAAGVAHAQPAPSEPEEVIVFADPFARWDGTRWLVRTQLGMPLPYPMYARVNHEMEAVAIDLSLVFACEKTWRRGPKRFEVSCKIEDAGIKAASWRDKEPYADEVLQQFDANLTGAELQLLVADDGRIIDIGLEGLIKDNDREKAVQEQTRRLLVRLMAGFHLKLPPRNQIRQGQWLEYDSKLFAMPVVLDARRGNFYDAKRGAAVVNTMGGSYVIHQLDRFRGHLVVQSVGKGTVKVGSEDGGCENFFKLDLDGVSIFDESSGIMSERVWSLRGRTTAGSCLADGRADPIYFHLGRMQMLDEDQHPDVGTTELIARPGNVVSTLPVWTAIE